MPSDAPRRAIIRLEDGLTAKRIGLVVHSLAQLHSKCTERLPLPPPHCFYTDDGSAIDSDDYLLSLERNSVVVALPSNVDFLDGAMQSLRRSLLRLEVTTDVHLLQRLRVDHLQAALAQAIDDNDESESDWHDEKSTISKEQVMRRCAQDRIRSYFYKGRQAAARSVGGHRSELYATRCRPLFATLWKRLQENEFHGALFDRTSPQLEERLCDETGRFGCEGDYRSASCRFRHWINPYRSREERIVFQTWNLDHQIEKSRSVLPCLVAALRCRCRREINAAYFYELLFTRRNLKFVHVVCHDKSAHSELKCDESCVFVVDEEKVPSSSRRQSRRLAENGVKS